MKKIGSGFAYPSKQNRQCFGFPLAKKIGNGLAYPSKKNRLCFGFPLQQKSAVVWHALQTKIGSGLASPTKTKAIPFVAALLPLCVFAAALWHSFTFLPPFILNPLCYIGPWWETQQTHSFSPKFLEVAAWCRKSILGVDAGIIAFRKWQIGRVSLQIAGDYVCEVFLVPAGAVSWHLSGVCEVVARKLGGGCDDAAYWSRETISIVR